MSIQRRPAWFKSFLSRYKRSVVFALALGLVASGCAALLMFTSGYLISATAMPGITLFSVMVPVACVQLFGFGRPAARYLERLVSHDWVLKVTSDLRSMLYWGIEARVDDPSRKRAAGEYLGLLADDVAHLQNLYLRVVFPTLIALLLGLGAALLFGWFSIPFALLMLLVFALVVGLLPFAALLATRALSEQAKSLRADSYASLTDDVIGATDWALAGRSYDAMRSHLARGDALREVEAKVRATQRTLSLFGTLALGAAICVVIAWSGASFGGDGMAANLVAAFVLGFFPLIEAFTVLPAAVSQVTVHEDAIRRLDGFVAEPAPTCDNASDPSVEPKLDDTAISLVDIAYSYPGSSRPALEDVTLEIKRGSSVAILGRSGSGKSTLAELMRQTIEPSTGRISVAGSIGYLGQTPYLFNRSLRANLALGNAQASDDELAAALDAVGLDDKLESLENGLDTVIGETGIGFSGGEAHRIALARVLVADAPIIVVDEPFAALDPETENDLLDSLFNATEDRTLVVITHHLAQIERFDRVIFIENGRIDLDGAPADLMRANARFRKLVEFDRRNPLPAVS